ncbi:oligosaccharide flippase family protein [Agrobacterium salinitolerans]
MSIKQRHYFTNLPNSPLFGNFCAYAASEGAAKISRLMVVVVLARFLSPSDIGIAAAAMATSDILKSLTENGVGQRIIIAPQDRLEAECNAAHRIFWIWCAGLFLLQILVASALWLLGSSTQSFLLLAALASEYLIMPAGLVQCALAMRRGKLRSTAAISGAQNVGANLMTCCLAVIFPGPWAIVAPKVLTGPIWLIGMRKIVHWQPARDFDRSALKPFIRFGLPVLGVELLKAVRQQSDKLIVGALLGTDALGLYFFAYNASTGIATSLTSAFSTVLFPYLAGSDNRRIALRNGLLMSLAIVSPIVLAQALAAPTYVHFVFGDTWGPVAPLVAILSLMALPNTLWAVSSQWLRSNDRAGTEFLFSLAIGCITSVVTALATPFGLLTVAWASMLATVITQVVASAPALSAAIGVRLTTKSQPAIQGA